TDRPQECRLWKARTHSWAVAAQALCPAPVRPRSVVIGRIRREVQLQPGMQVASVSLPPFGFHDQDPAPGECAITSRRLRAEAGVREPQVAAGRQPSPYSVLDRRDGQDDVCRRWPQVEEPLAVPPEDE